MLITSSTPMRSMKVIILGNGRIGKTTFVKHLTNVLVHNPLVGTFNKIAKKKVFNSIIALS